MTKIIDFEQSGYFLPFKSEVKPLTPEQLKTEFMFLWAEMIIRNMLDGGVICLDEYLLIMAENRLSFPTYLAPLF
jgi:hypothetical protein